MSTHRARAGCSKAETGPMVKARWAEKSEKERKKSNLFCRISGQLVAGSMRHRVEDDVDPERIGALFGKLAEEVLKFLFAFPAVAVVRVVTGDGHHPAFVIEQRADVNVAAFLAIVVLPGDV